MTKWEPFHSRIGVLQRLASVSRGSLIAAAALFVAAAFLAIWAWPVSRLFFMLVWTVVVLRVVGYRATLSRSTVATYLMTGALLQLVVAPIPAKLFAPFLSPSELSGEYPTLAGLLLTVEFGLLLAPVIIALFRTHIYVMTSIADAFLLAFVTALGAQLPGSLIQTGLRSQSVETLFPFLWSGKFAYWCGIVALVWAVTLRVLRRRRLAAGLAVVVFLHLANEFIRWIPSLVFWELSGLGSGGRTFSLTIANTAAWVVLITLAAFTWAEGYWVSRTAPGSGRRRGFLYARVRAFLEDLKPQRLRAVGLQRQHQIVRAELAHSTDDPHIERVEGQLRTLILETRTPGQPVDEQAVQCLPPLRRWGHLAVVTAPWILIVLLLVLFPKLPLSLTRPIWSFLTLAPPNPQLPTFLNMILMGILVWRYLPMMGSTAVSEGDANARLRFMGGRLVLHLSMVSVFLVLSKVDLAGFVGLSGLTPPWGGPGFGQPELATLLLLFATAASGLVADSLPRQAMGTLRKRVRNALTLAQAPVVVWLGVFIGAVAFQAVREILWLGDYAAAILAAVITGGLSFVITLLLRLSVARLEAFLAARVRRSEQRA